MHKMPMLLEWNMCNGRIFPQSAQKIMNDMKHLINLKKKIMNTDTILNLYTQIAIFTQWFSPNITYYIIYKL